MQTIARLDRRTIREIINNPHDALFRGLINDELRAHALIRDHLPASIFGISASDVVRQVNIAYVDDYLRQSFADGVFEIGGTPGMPERVAILEHKHKAQRMTIEQLVGYVISVARHYAARGVWPEIFVIVIHTGAEPWRVPGAKQWDDGDSSYLARNGLRLRFVRSSVVEMPYEELSSAPAVRAALGALAAAQDVPAPRDTVRLIFRDLAGLPPGASSLWHMIYCYGLVKFGLEREKYWALIREADPKAAEAEMATMLEQMMAEREARGEARGLARGVERGEARGLERGEARGLKRGEARGLKRGEARGLKRGEARGRAEMLVRLLRQRFGFVPAEVEAQVRAASVAEVDAWFNACADAPDLESVFKKSRTN